MKTILFVCSGNTCRSPMAQALFMHRACEAGAGNQYRAASAGLFALSGQAASENAVITMAQMGLDISGHRALPVTPDLLAAADIVLAMGCGHREALKNILDEDRRAKVWLLMDYACGMDMDIDDPFGGDLDTYRRCARQIDQAVQALIKKAYRVYEDV